MAAKSVNNDHNIIDLRARVEVMRNSMLKAIGPMFSKGAIGIGDHLTKLAEMIDGLINSRDVDAKSLAALVKIAFHLAEAHCQMVTAAHKAFLGSSMAPGEAAIPSATHCKPTAGNQFRPPLSSISTVGIGQVEV